MVKWSTEIMRGHFDRLRRSGISGFESESERSGAFGAGWAHPVADDSKRHVESGTRVGSVEWGTSQAEALYAARFRLMIGRCRRPVW